MFARVHIRFLSNNVNPVSADMWRMFRVAATMGVLASVVRAEPGDKKAVYLAAGNRIYNRGVELTDADIPNLRTMVDASYTTEALRDDFFGLLPILNNGKVVELEMQYIGVITYVPTKDGKFQPDSDHPPSPIEFIPHGRLASVTVEWQCDPPITLGERSLRQITNDNDVVRFSGTNDRWTFGSRRSDDGEFHIYLVDHTKQVTCSYDIQTGILYEYVGKPFSHMPYLSIRKELFTSIRIRYTGEYIWSLFKN